MFVIVQLTASEILQVISNANNNSKVNHWQPYAQKPEVTLFCNGCYGDMNNFPKIPPKNCNLAVLLSPSVAGS